MNTQPLALLLDDNLMSAMRVQAQLQRMNYRVHTARELPAPSSTTPEPSEGETSAGETTADAQSADETPQLVLINLGSRGLNGAMLIGVCRERFPASRVVGFCGHLEADIRRAAKAAGIDKILTNDQALSDLQSVLAKTTS